MLIFILGGIRSGKSRYAKEIAEKFKYLSGEKNIVYIATYKNDGNDKEMTERIKSHKMHRTKEWDVLEIGNFSDINLKMNKISNAIIMIDCLTLLVSDFLLQFKDADEGRITKELEKFINEIKKSMSENNNKVIIISNEVGQGIIPLNRISRKYADMLGRANQVIANHCDEFYFMYAGISIRIK